MLRFGFRPGLCRDNLSGQTEILLDVNARNVIARPARRLSTGLPACVFARSSDQTMQE